MDINFTVSGFLKHDMRYLSMPYTMESKLAILNENIFRVMIQLLHISPTVAEKA
jgi:hypothetical protein